MVVVNPGWGDEVQAAKAGLLEIADVFVVNKADRAGADEAVGDLQRMTMLADPAGWQPPVVSTVATTGAGVEALWQAVDDHRTSMTADGELERRRRARRGVELRQALQVEIERRARTLVGPEAWAATEAAVLDGSLDARGGAAPARRLTPILPLRPATTSIEFYDPGTRPSPRSSGPGPRTT